MECMLEGELDEDDVIEAFDKWAAKISEAKEDQTIPSESDDDFDPNDVEILPVPPQAEPEIEQNTESEKKETQAAVNRSARFTSFRSCIPALAAAMSPRSADGIDVTKTSGLSRFDEGWVLTRIVYKGMPCKFCRDFY